jgi:hypothetical protein
MHINPQTPLLVESEVAGFHPRAVVRNWGHDRAKGEVDEAWKNAPLWLRECEAEYRRRGMKPTTIVRFTHELLSLHHDFGINLATVTEKALLGHLDAYSKTHKSNSYRRNSCSLGTNRMTKKEAAKIAIHE